MNILFKEVNTKDSLRQFVQFPFQLYSGNPYWIPPFKNEEINTFLPEKNCVYQHSETVLFTAWEGDKMVGRIAGLINEMENDFIKDRHARFGWIDYVDNPKVSKGLLHQVETWAREKEMRLLKGPYGFNQLDKNGMLTSGFDSIGTANSTYNFEYYPRHLTDLGYVPDLEWLEIKMKMPDKPIQRFERFTNVAKEKYQLQVKQPKSQKEMLRLGKEMFQLLMETYQNLPGFVPISEQQQNEYITNYIKFLRKDFTVVVYDKNNQPIAFGVTLPSMTKAFKKANGKLFPFGILHVLAARQWNDTADLALIGVTEEWRKKGAHGLVFSESIKALIRQGIKTIQINPMLEQNTHVLSLWKDFDHHVYKRRKTFKKLL